jgi:hypothetical protein
MPRVDFREIPSSFLIAFPPAGGQDEFELVAGSKSQHRSYDMQTPRFVAFCLLVVFAGAAAAWPADGKPTKTAAAPKADPEAKASSPRLPNFFGQH